MSKNIDIAKTIITDGVRVSSAAIFYEGFPIDYYQYETWIFSDIDNMPSKQIIHGAYSEPNESLHRKAKIIHEYISNELKEKLRE